MYDIARDVFAIIGIWFVFAMAFALLVIGFRRATDRMGERAQEKPRRVPRTADDVNRWLAAGIIDDVPSNTPIAPGTYWDLPR